MNKKLPKLSMAHNVLIAITTGSVLTILMLAMFSNVLAFQIEGVDSGWECGTRLDRVWIASQSKWFNAWNTPIGATKIPWSPKEVQFDPTALTVADWDYWQEADLYVHVDDPIHTTEDQYHELLKNQAGDKVILAPLDEFIREIPRQVGDTSFWYYHHAYAYLTTVRTDASWLSQLGWQALTETKGEEGIATQFTIRSRFTVDPWLIIGNQYVSDDNGDTYQCSYAWAGIMGASVDLVVYGFDERWLNELPAAEVPLYVTTGYEIDPPMEHAGLSMYVDVDGSQTADNRWNTLTQTVDIPTDPATILGIPRDVYIDVSGELFAGAQTGAFMQPIPRDVFMQITIRVDVLTAAGFVPVTGTDPLPDPPDPIAEGPTPFWYPMAYALGQWWGENYFLVATVVVIIVMVVGLVFFSRIVAIIKVVKG